MAERDFLVIYEDAEDGLPGDDQLVLDIESGRAHSLGELDVEQKVDLELSNTTNRMGTVGFTVTGLGTLLGLGLMATFAMSYPDDWYDATGHVARTSLIQNVLLLSIAAVILLVAGTVLTHYGRRIKARGNLSRMRIVEKTTQARARLD